LQAIRRRRSRNWSARRRIRHRPQGAGDSHVSKAPFVRPLFQRAGVFVSASVARSLTRPWVNESFFPSLSLSSSIWAFNTLMRRFTGEAPTHRRRESFRHLARDNHLAALSLEK